MTAFTELGLPKRASLEYKRCKRLDFGVQKSHENPIVGETRDAGIRIPQINGGTEF